MRTAPPGTCRGRSSKACPELGYQLKLVPRDIYRLGIAAVNRYCEKTHGKAFADLDAPTRDTVLGALEKGGAQIDDVPPAVFFGQLLQNTREGYFCDPVHGGNHDMAAWKMIGFPGARADFRQPERQVVSVRPRLDQRERS